MLTTLVLAAGLTLGQMPEATPGNAPAVRDSQNAEQLRTKVLALVRQLDAPELARREAAEKELVALGSDVLPHLPDVTDRTPAEVKNRLGRVRNALVKLEVESATRPSMVTLQGEMKASEAFAEIERQTGNRLVDNRARFNQASPDPTIKLDLDNVPFWQALDTILDEANLTLYNYDEERGGLAYTSRGEGAGPRVGRGSYSGLFRLEPTRIEATRDLRGSDMHAVRLYLDAVWEPRVRPIVLEIPLADVAAKDEAGNEIGIDRSAGTLEVPVEGFNSSVEIELPLTAPPRSVKQIDLLQGKFNAVVLGKVETFEFANVDKARSAQLERGGVIVVVDNCRRNGDIYEVNLRVRFDQAANALESHRGWIYDNDAYMVDPQGRQIVRAALEAALLAVNEVGLSYKFDLGDDDATAAGHTFVYKTPAAIIKIPVDFELKAIPLP